MCTAAEKSQESYKQLSASKSNGLEAENSSEQNECRENKTVFLHKKRSTVRSK